MNAPISLKPFESETKSSIWAIDNALRWKPRGADAFGAPSKKNATDLQNVRDLLQPARSDAVGALLVFLHLLEGETEPIGQLLLAHCKHHAAHAHPTANMLVDGPLRGSWAALASLRAHPASGDAPATPPTSVMNARLLIRSPRRQAQAASHVRFLLRP
jgi:hypothetical protein